MFFPVSRVSRLAHVSLDFDLDVFAFEPLDHELILLARREARPHRLPGPTGPDPAVFGLGDPDETFLWHRINGMVIDLVAPFEFPGDRMFARQGVGLMHRHQPVPGKGLLRPVPEVRLIARIHRDGAPVGRVSCPLTDFGVDTYGACFDIVTWYG